MAKKKAPSRKANGQFESRATSERRARRQAAERRAALATKRKREAARLGWSRKKAIAESLTPADARTESALAAREITANRNAAETVAAEQPAPKVGPEVVREFMLSVRRTMRALAPSTPVDIVKHLPKTPKLERHDFLRVETIAPMSDLSRGRANSVIGSSARALALFEAASIVGQSREWPEELRIRAVAVVVSEAGAPTYGGLKYYSDTEEYQFDAQSGVIPDPSRTSEAAQSFFERLGKKRSGDRIIEVQLRAYYGAPF